MWGSRGWARGGGHTHRREATPGFSEPEQNEEGIHVGKRLAWGFGAQVYLRKASVRMCGWEQCWKMVCIQRINHVSKCIRDIGVRFLTVRRVSYRYGKKEKGHKFCDVGWGTGGMHVNSWFSI